MREFKAMSIRDLEIASNAHKKKMDKIVRFHKSNMTIVINLAYPYEIDLDRIKNETDLLIWVNHLCEKTWMTAEVLSDFMEKVAEIKGLKIYDP
jgi:hypothetical protein